MSKKGREGGRKRMKVEKREGKKENEREEVEEQKWEGKN